MITPEPIRLTVQGTTTIHIPSPEGQTIPIHGSSETHIIRGVSPTVDMTGVEGGTLLTITDIDGAHTATILNGAEGAPGADGEDGSDGADGVGIASVELNDDYTLTFTYTDGDSTTTGSVRGPQGEPGQDGEDGADGNPGVDGHTPVIAASKSGGVTTITVDGETVATVNDGEDGTDGTDGIDGQDGHSPVVTASKSGTVTTISVDGSPIATINDGTDGTDGQDGAPGVIQSIQMNGDTVQDVDGVVNLGTVITAHQDISGKANKATVAIVEDGDTATQNHSNGAYIVWKGSLYIASANIATGDTLSASNLTAKTSGIGGEVASLNSSVGTLSTNYTTLSNNVANIGTIKTGTNATSLSVAANTWTTICSVDLTAGTWIINGGHQWGASFSDMAIVQLANGTSAIAPTTVRYVGTSGGGCNVSCIYKLDSSATINLRAYQTSSAAKTASNVSLKAIRIA